MTSKDSLHEEKQTSDDANSSSEDEGPIEVIEPISLFRSRRSNAGANIASLISENQDKLVLSGKVTDADIYATAYGGFQEDEDDEKDVDPTNFEDGSDIIDSDFTDSESDEANDENEDDEKSKKRKKRKNRGVITKAYKEPQRNSLTSIIVKSHRPKKEQPQFEFPSGISLRDSTKKRTQLQKAKSKILKKVTVTTDDEEYTTDADKARKRSNHVPTQEQRMKQALITEKENLTSLHQFTLAEIEAKQKRHALMRRRKMLRGDRIRKTEYKVYHENGEADKISLFETNTDVAFNTLFASNVTYTNYQERAKVNQKKQNMRCVVTGQPAKYIEPYTKLPYSDSRSFKTIRYCLDLLMASKAHERVKQEKDCGETAIEKPPAKLQAVFSKDNKQICIDLRPHIDIGNVVIEQQEIIKLIQNFVLSKIHSQSAIGQPPIQKQAIYVIPSSTH